MVKLFQDKTRQKATHEKVIEKLTVLTSIIAVLATDHEIVLSALNSNFKDFEDALQNYSAEYSNHIDIIVTRNTKDYKQSMLKVMNPTEFLDIFLH